MPAIFWIFGFKIVFFWFRRPRICWMPGDDLEQVRVRERDNILKQMFHQGVYVGEGLVPESAFTLIEISGVGRMKD